VNLQPTAPEQRAAYRRWHDGFLAIQQKPLPVTAAGIELSARLLRVAEEITYTRELLECYRKHGFPGQDADDDRENIFRP
jgi:hypothetical protein